MNPPAVQQPAVKKRTVTRKGALLVVAVALFVPFLITAGIVMWLSSGDSAEPAPRPPAQTAAIGSFNATGLPPVRLAKCPSAAELLAEPATGPDILPDLTLECIGEIGTAESVPLRRLGGVPTVINLWASWCTPCRAEMPDLEKVSVAAGDRVRILGVNTKDSPEAARATLENTQVHYSSLADPDASLRDQIGSKFMPTTLFVRADGRIAHRKLGPMTGADLRELIAEHLGVTF